MSPVHINKPFKEVRLANKRSPFAVFSHKVIALMGMLCISMHWRPDTRPVTAQLTVTAALMKPPHIWTLSLPRKIHVLISWMPDQVMRWAAKLDLAALCCQRALCCQHACTSRNAITQMLACRELAIAGPKGMAGKRWLPWIGMRDIDVCCSSPLFQHSQQSQYSQQKMCVVTMVLLVVQEQLWLWYLPVDTYLTLMVVLQMCQAQDINLSPDVRLD